MIESFNSCNYHKQNFGKFYIHLRKMAGLVDKAIPIHFSNSFVKPKNFNYFGNFTPPCLLMP